ncbi:uncharacterized protein [Oscarella lobularis]|uniref:uncharacterized protein n=1 Tax=Oscarella lobularis TaxID=121494 RepID=UPI0033140814
MVSSSVFHCAGLLVVHVYAVANCRNDIERSHRQRTPTKSRGGKPRFLLHVNPDNVDEGDRIERENEKEKGKEPKDSNFAKAAAAPPTKASKLSQDVETSGMTWDADAIAPDTRLVMGVRANKKSHREQAVCDIIFDRGTQFYSRCCAIWGNSRCSYESRSQCTLQSFSTLLLSWTRSSKTN